MLIAEQLHKRFGAQVALHALDLRIEAGEVYALLGPNGAGKTTTINCFLGFTKPDGGRVLVAGADPALHAQAARHALAYIPEQVNLYPWFSGLENLQYFSELAGRRHKAADLTGFLEEAGLSKDAHGRHVEGYSKGMRQKVGIAIALAKEAKALLLDEPTSGLDPGASHEFSLILQRVRQRGVAVLMATHDIFRALDVATRVGVMHNGRLLAERETSRIAAADLEALYLETIRLGVA